jgi:hypothetical protein
VLFRSLYLLESAAAPVRDNFEMPPLPPDGSFDARFASNRFLERADAAAPTEFPILLHGAVYPVTISWNHSTTSQSSMSVNGTTIPMSGGGSVIISEQGSPISVRVNAFSDRPAQFSLLQNYPNPFNPSTLIRYALPMDARIRLTVYDVLGREVAVLVDEIQSAGYRSVTWNSNANPTGIYFAKLEVASTGGTGAAITQVRKMLLVK